MYVYTPFQSWRQGHRVHHEISSNLHYKQDNGQTSSPWTVQEFKNASVLNKLWYLFAFGPLSYVISRNNVSHSHSFEQQQHSNTDTSPSCPSSISSFYNECIRVSKWIHVWLFGSSSCGLVILFFLNSCQCLLCVTRDIFCFTRSTHFTVHTNVVILHMMSIKPQCSVHPFCKFRIFWNSSHSALSIITYITWIRVFRAIVFKNATKLDSSTLKVSRVFPCSISFAPCLSPCMMKRRESFELCTVIYLFK